MTDKLSSLLVELAKRTREGLVKWEPTAVKGVYQVAFSQYTVQIATERNKQGAADYVLSILNSEGRVIERAADPDLSPRVPNASGLMNELHTTAGRQALSADPAIDNLLSDLSKLRS